MGFNSVYGALVEVFPQVDIRILKAVAIEHSKDADAAVEFILFEVLPIGRRTQDEAVLTPDNQEVKHSPVGAVESDLVFSLGHEEELKCANVDLPSEPSFLDEIGASCLLSSTHKGIEGFHIETEMEELMFSGKHQDFKLSSISDKDSVLTDSQSICGQVAHDPNAVDILLSRIDSSRTSSSEEESLPTISQLLQILVEEKVDLVDGDGKEEKSAHTSITENAEPGSRDLFGDTVEQLKGDEVLDFENEAHPTGMTTHSGQTISINFLDEFVTDAKDYKKTLSSEMESLMGLMREVELQEKAVGEAKEEASRAGIDSLTKVEEVKKALQLAKESNDMHAGEVYGEKSILATEARELQSRLLYLSDERDRSLSIIDEMHQNLEVRLAKAAAEKEAAEKEIIEKEESARSFLIEQENIMEMVVQDSKKLQQEAEENAKLREFLMDRGRIVDALQGEIAVICEDINLLKEKVDGHLPIGRGLLSLSHMSNKLASSNISSKSLSSDQNYELSKSSESLKTAEQELTASGMSVGSNNKEDSGDARKVFSEDDWEFFEEENEPSSWNVVSG